MRLIEREEENERMSVFSLELFMPWGPVTAQQASTVCYLALAERVSQRKDGGRNLATSHTIAEVIMRNGLRHFEDFQDKDGVLISLLESELERVEDLIIIAEQLINKQEEEV